MLQSLRKCDEKLIADQVPETVVDDLEPVDIQKQDRKHQILVPLGASNQAAEPVEEQCAVRQAGERIGHLGSGDVGLGACHPMRLALRIADSEGPAQHPSIGAVSVKDSMFVLEMRIETF